MVLIQPVEASPPTIAQVTRHHMVHQVIVPPLLFIKDVHITVLGSGTPRQNTCLDSSVPQQATTMHSLQHSTIPALRRSVRLSNSAV